ncbi:MAG TPA: HDOD domain-containing protein [Bryobacteraceae bacterium]|nr:HDOD domain-containing protein [Bryobacteraceae bacterium]
MAALPQSLNTRARAMACLSKLPALSPLLMRLVQTLAGSGDDISFGKVAQLIERDAVVAGNVLRVVNSPLYQRRAPVQSIRHAIVLLGLAKVRNLALGMSVSHMWIKTKAAPGWSMPEFNQHSVATAVLADLLTQKLRVIESEAAFLAGLFHDLGRLLIAVGLSTEHTAVARLREQNQQPLSACEQTILGFHHGELSADVLAEWRLPFATQAAVRHHHAPENDRTLASAGEFRLSQILYAAELHLEDGVPDGLEALGLGSRLEPILEEFSAESKQISCLF